MTRRLFRKPAEGILAGVASGIADHFRVDPTLVRLGFVALTFVSGVGPVLYVACWVLVPRRDLLPAAGGGHDSPSLAKRLAEEVEEAARRAARHLRAAVS